MSTLLTSNIRRRRLRKAGIGLRWLIAGTAGLAIVLSACSGGDEQQQAEAVEQQAQQVQQVQQSQQEPPPQQQQAAAQAAAQAAQQDEQQQQAEQAEAVPPGRPNLLRYEVQPVAEQYRAVIPQTDITLTLAENVDGSSAPIELGRIGASTVSGSGVVGHFAFDDKFDVGITDGVISYIGSGEDYESQQEYVFQVDVLVGDAVTGVEFAWQEPGRLGSDSLSYYELEVREEDDAGWTWSVTTQETSMLIEDIPVFGTYIARVRAVSDAGAGDWAVLEDFNLYGEETETYVTVTVQIEDQPDPPQAPRAPGLNEGNPAHSAAALSWGAASVSDGPPVDTYEYRYRSDGGSWRRVTGLTVRSATVTGLREGTEYEFQVRAVSADGASDWSRSAFHTTSWRPFEPVVATGTETGVGGDQVYYSAERDTFSDRVRTDVRMFGSELELLLDIVCFDDENWSAVGFRLVDLDWDPSFPDSVEVTWRIDDGPVQRDVWPIQLVGSTASAAIQSEPGSEFLNIVSGSSGDRWLYVRIGVRGVQEDAFDLRLFRSTPVQGNLERCGSY